MRSLLLRRACFVLTGSLHNRNERVLKGGFEETEIKEAHRAVMRQNHPDTLGSNYLALKINKAKEVLLKGSGIENERGMYDTEKQQRAKLADPE